MSKKQTASKKQLRLTLFNLALMHNKKRFKAGTVFTAEELATMFYQAVPKRKGAYEVVHKENLRMVRLQRDVNDLLRTSGLYLQSSNYYKYFSVVDKPTTKRQVERMSASIDRLQVVTSELEDGIKTRTTRRNWGNYVKHTSESIKDLVQPVTSTRHDKLVKHLARIK